MNEQIISWVNDNYGSNVSIEYYKSIDLWLNWWHGYYRPFHHYALNNGKQRIERDLYTLKMGKKICEDWASLLLNSRTHILISDENTSSFVQGRRETGGVLGSNSFWTKANRLIEKAFATGTGAVTVYVSEIKVDGETVLISPNAKIGLNYISAEYIIPITTDNGSITEAAFVSERTENGKRFLNMEVHHRDETGNYIISYYRFEAYNNQIVQIELPDNMIADFHTGSPVPWFAVFTPNIENNIKTANGLGISIIANLIDNLKAVDLCFNNFCSDFYLGQKKVFLEKSLAETTADGFTFAPDDVHQQLFEFISFPLENQNEGTKQFIQEFNPNLRVDDNTKGVQSALDYLSFMAGLGNKHYQFNGSTVVTATQYTGDKQDLIQNADKHYASVEQFLINLTRSIIFIGKHLIGADIAEDPEIEIDFDKSVIIDDTAERLQHLQEVRDGIMAKWEFRMKYYGETEEEARKIISEIEGDQDDDDLLGFFA